MTEIEKMMSRLQEIENDNLKLKEFRVKQESVYNGLVKVIEDLKELSKVVAPFSLPKTKNRSTVNYEELSAECFDNLKVGTQLTTEMLGVAYPNLDYGQIQTLITHILKNKGVEKVRDGKNIRVFMR